MNNDQSNIQDTLLEDYSTVVSIWEDFCKNHSMLYEKTCDEYVALLCSNIEELEHILEQKQKYIDKINIIEGKRSKLIEAFNSKRDQNSQIENVSDLLIFMHRFEQTRESNVLHRLNLLLIDIIEKIQEQTKKNQYFLNKAIRSIDEMRDSFAGTKKFNTYTAMGTTQSNSAR